jgi:hypothetical protein
MESTLAARVTPLRATDAESIRIAPHDDGAEQAQLGALLISNSAYSRVSEFLLPEHFGTAVHARIYAAIGKLVERGENANPVTLKSLFDQDDALTVFGGGRYLAELAGAAITILNAEDYARHVHDLYLRRQLMALGEDLISNAHTINLERSASDILLSHKASLSEINAHDPCPLSLDVLRVSHWLTRDIPEPDFLLGEFLSTTCRVELIGPTGLGKTNFLMALGMAVADGRDFLHWRGSGKPRRVLFVDGEMSRRLMKKRIADAVRRYGNQPETFYVFNREDIPDLQPLNTEAGQRAIDRIINELGGVDLLVPDNIQSLLSGDMKDEEPWQLTLPWVRDLTRRSIGQIWTHHTGHDESHGYGTKTREWQLDTVCLMEAIERPDADIAFLIKFTKARERSPENRSDFEPAIITLANDEWSSERGEHVRTKPKARDRALELLKDAIARDGAIPPANEHIPPNTQCLSESLWRRCCELGCISEGSPDAARIAFKRSANQLIKIGQVGKWGDWVWVIR